MLRLRGGGGHGQLWCLCRALGDQPGEVELGAERIEHGDVVESLARAEVAQHPAVDDHRMPVPGHLADDAGQVVGRVSTAHVGRVLSGKRDRGDESLEPVGLVGPHACLQPPHRSVVEHVDR